MVAQMWEKKLAKHGSNIWNATKFRFGGASGRCDARVCVTLHPMMMNIRSFMCTGIDDLHQTSTAEDYRPALKTVLKAQC